MINEPPWRSGFFNMLRKENGLWWGTRKWWVQSLIWFLILNGIVLLLLWIVPSVDQAKPPEAAEVLDVFIQFLSVFGVFGVMVHSQSLIVAEKRSGTAAWIMSNPISRSAFVLAKLIANGVAILSIIVVLQGLIAYFQFTLQGDMNLRPVEFFAALTLQGLHMVFYLTLALMLGTFFNNRGPVIGISIAILIGQDLISQIIAMKLPWLPTLMPMRLADMAAQVAQGGTLSSFTPVITTLLMSVLFILLALWRFGREEF
jgi:ABC-type transport system involved in multi-copper enzyme maturation permease subunit